MYCAYAYIERFDILYTWKPIVRIIIKIHSRCITYNCIQAFTLTACYTMYQKYPLHVSQKKW